ncbi:anion permease [Halorussus gelatinilyticus]|uniref:Phosphate transporter n=1 Tax=Halorussus gelatinilyticus TaxID=2937524 RepID=A0A8U0INV6_9EURY|nr:inorganic phosphate transporter [Halorussus gelatinilyticus]UPW01689.1 anion permease [Halorussus gelatinilyticus]
MFSALLVLGVAVAVFVGFNIGGSSTGVAFGPAVGSGVTSKVAAAALMSGFALLGGATVGRGVIKTLGGRVVAASHFNLAAGVVVLFFVGVALLVSNLFGVPASTSMTAVGAIAGMGLAGGFLRWAKVGEIVSWWLVSPILAFWTCAVVGRYLYPHLAARFSIERSSGPLLDWRDLPVGSVPVGPADGTTRGELVGNGLVVAIGCYMAFSAGASNVANAVAPLYGARALGGEMLPYVAIGASALAVGSFTIARRTLDTVGNDLTDLPLVAALVVETVSASLIGFLSHIDIPASLAVSATMSIVGLGWGRASRSKTVTDVAGAAITGESAASDAAEPMANGTGRRAGDEASDGTGRPEEVAPIGEESGESNASDHFDAAATARVVFLWILTPSLSATASYLLFTAVPLYTS